VGVNKVNRRWRLFCWLRGKQRTLNLHVYGRSETIRTIDWQTGSFCWRGSRDARHRAEACEDMFLPQGGAPSTQDSSAFSSASSWGMDHCTWTFGLGEMSSECKKIIIDGNNRLLSRSFHFIIIYKHLPHQIASERSNLYIKVHIYFTSVWMKPPLSRCWAGVLPV